MPQPGELIHGKYRILQQLADGGMGTIYEARHEVLGTTVALKMLHANLAKRPNLVARFLQEARLSATLLSPHIVRVLDVEQGPQGAILVMELLRGETLQARMDRDRRMDVAVAIDLALQMLSGLEVAHAANVVHRDLKPDNVFLVPTPPTVLVKLLDFGIAKLRTSPEFDRGLTRPGVVMGTPEYMAPEQAFSADTVDARADLYALGVILFEMLSGQRPVQGDDPKNIAQKVFSGHVKALSALLPSLPMQLVSAVHRAMAPAPKGRFTSASEMREALLPFGPTAARSSTSVLGPVALSVPPAPTQPNPGSLSSMPPPYGSHTPPLGTPPAPGSVTPPGVAASPAPTGPQLTPLPVVSPAPPAAPTGPLGGWPQERSAPGVAPTYPPEGVSTTQRDPMPQAFPSQPPPAAAPPTAWGPGPSPAATAPASPLAHGTVLPEGGYGPAHGYGGTNYGGSGYTSYGQGAGPGQTAQAQAYQPSPAPPMPDYAAAPYLPPMPPPARRRGPPIGLIATLAALAGGLAVVLVLALRGSDSRTSDTPTPPTPPPPTTTMTAPTVSAAPTLPPFPTALPTTTFTATPPPPNTGSRPPVRDGGVPDGGPLDAGADAGDAGLGPLGLPLPGIPSALPPLPSALPTQIKIPIPLPF